MKEVITHPSFETKALYNSMRMLREDEAIETTWKTRDWRVVDMNHLFDELRALGISVNKALFYQWATHCDTPEDLLEYLFLDEEIEEEQLQQEIKDRLYLTLFELWRRLVPEKRSLSTIADDIDHAIFAFDRESSMSFESVESLLEEWVRVIESMYDEGQSLSDVFRAIEPYFAHNVQEFIVDFILDALAHGHVDLVEPLFEKVRNYLTIEPLWTRIIDLKLHLRDDDIDELHKRLGELVAHILTTPQTGTAIFFSLCDIALDLDKEELFLRLLDRLLPHVQEREDIEIICDLLFDFVGKKPTLISFKEKIEQFESQERQMSLQDKKSYMQQLITQIHNT